MFTETRIKNEVQKLIHLETELEKGEIKIPRFQRQFAVSYTHLTLPTKA